MIKGVLMRFFYAKHEQVCRKCKGIINYGDEAVVLRWKHNNIFIPLVFHTACYIEWVTDNFNRRWRDWKLGASPRRIRKRRGRKFIYSNRKQAKDVNRLKSLLYYHKKAGNEGKVAELENRLRELLQKR